MFKIVIVCVVGDSYVERLQDHITLRVSIFVELSFEGVLNHVCAFLHYL